ncbi:glycosyltransferase family 4 protein [Blastococcus litoris]|uniref:glycosyltransferase family 4 protein n=1 Tax=Blastococcus litoris TaxID=2171622 RepID=UPI000E302C77|nr:glycosyltransferase family 4 protein [Blastococcus litoris]
MRQTSSLRPLRIAMIAPPWFTVPPRGYGGVENMCADLVDGLVDRGHEITLIGAGLPGTRASRFVATYADPPSARLGEPLPEVLHSASVAHILDGLDVDLVHDHTLAGPLQARGRRVPTVVTMHGPVAGEAGEYYRQLGDTVDLVAISDAQRRAAPDLSWLGTVHNAVDVESFPFRAEKEEMLLFLGRLHPDKGVHLAIDAARSVGLPIVVAGKCSEPLEREYYRTDIEPRLGPDVTIFGTADAVAKRDLLSRAAALVFPILWEEPFGMVMIEAMACGTPVVALRRGAVPEVVVDGVTGVLCDDPAEFPAAITTARSLSPADCRERVQSRFDAGSMVVGYEALYRRALLGRAPTRRDDAHLPAGAVPAGAAA